MELEWDEGKRLRNIKERGLDFADVERFDPASVRTSPDLRHDYGERRFNSIGYLDGRLCKFCWTPRNGKVRIISLRKANARECEAYEAEPAPDA